MVKLKVEQPRNIPIQQLVYSGSWMRMIANTKIELKHVGDGIILLVNDVQQPVQWKVYERRIAGDISHRGGYIPADKCWVFYVIGRDGRRYRYLCFLSLPGGNFHIGTRSDFRAVYTSSCYRASRSQSQTNLSQGVRGLSNIQQRSWGQRPRRSQRPQGPTDLSLGV
jgi:hypothetical protein